MLVSLLRIVELAEGKIFIDDLDTSTIGLRDLRNKIAIIPQGNNKLKIFLIKPVF